MTNEYVFSDNNLCSSDERTIFAVIMIKDTLIEFASIYGTASCSLMHDGNYLLKMIGKPAILFNSDRIMTITFSQCDNAYLFQGNTYDSHAFNADREFLLHLVDTAYKQLNLFGAQNAT